MNKWPFHKYRTSPFFIRITDVEMLLFKEFLRNCFINETATSLKESPRAVTAEPF